MKKLITIFSVIAILGISLWAWANHQEPVVSSGQVTWPQFFNGTSYYGPRIDASTRAMKTIAYEHAEIHSGSHYFIGGFDPDMGSGVTKVFTVYVPVGAAPPHIQFGVVSNKILTFYVYEETVGSTAVEIGTGSPVSPVNNNRNSSNTSGVHVTFNPNVYNIGSLSGNSIYLDSGKFGTSGQGNQNDIGGSAGHEFEMILKSGTTTIYQFISGEASAVVSYKGYWYEHTPKAN